MRISLRSKLTLILAVPLLVLVLAGVRGVQRASQATDRAARTADRIELSLAATTAALELAQERALSAGSSDRDIEVEKALLVQRDRTSAAIDTLRATLSGRRGITELGSEPALDQLGHLGDTRDAVDHGSRSADEVFGRYGEIIDPVLDLDRSVDLAGRPTIAAQLSSFQALSRALQDTVAEQGLLGMAFDEGSLDADDYRRLVELAASQDLWFEQFEKHATSQQLADYNKALALPETAVALRLRENAVSAGPNGALDGDAANWSNAVDRKAGALKAIADDTAVQLARGARSERADGSAERQRAMLTLSVTITLAMALVLALQRLALRPLQRLTVAAERAAHVNVPAAVEAAHRDGPDAARRALPPLPVPRDSDLGGLASAFNTTQDAALSLATNEASLRSKVNAVFLNFGHRTQDLVTRQLGHIDVLEARTEDPDMLSDLFLLDHLATRLRRNAESLMVMAGADSPRPWARPVSVVNVVRAAAAEAIDYSRVDVERIAPAAVTGPAANEVSHLLAELIDNALAFSASDSRVKIAGGWIESGYYLVTVSNTGAGMTTGQLEEANARISGSNLNDPGMSRYFGMFVVGRFARRHGIEVHLVPSRSEGTTAEIIFPDTLMTGAPTECQTTPGK